MKLTDMKNIGKTMAEKLESVEIDSAEKLSELGAEAAFFRLQAAYPHVCLVHLYTLEGAIKGIEFNNLPEERKSELKKFCGSLK